MLSSVIILAILCGSVFGVCILFLPTGVAIIRNHPNKLAIFLINLFLGWTFIGWVAALGWACSTSAQSSLHHAAIPSTLHDPMRTSNNFPTSAAAALTAGAPYYDPR